MVNKNTETSILDLVNSINTLDNISYKTLEKLEKIGIKRVIDLLFYFPINIVNRKKCENINELELSRTCIIKLKILKRVRLNKVLQVMAQDRDGEIINIHFFNTFHKYIDSYLPLNEEVIVIGVPEIYGGKIIINHPERVLRNKNLDNIKEIESVYRQHQDITSYKFQGFINQVLDILNKCTIEEWLESGFIKQNNLLSFKDAINRIHNPRNQKEIEQSKKNITRIAIDEMLAYHLALLYLRNNKELQEGIALKGNNTLNKKFLQLLPFKLTTDQIEALRELRKELEQDIQNTVLLQGDVGSGKTVVCFISTLFAIESGYQVAFMAPTEILATQHYEYFLPFAKELNLKISLLKGKEKKSNKTKIINELESGEIDILIGTHSLFQDKVSFKNLGLVIIDEQHRFGVKQRLMLSEKGKNPHIILTTATPIPRTLALASYGDIKSLEIKNKPQNRKEIITKTISKNKLEETLNFVKNKIYQGEKVFWICPLVEESEKVSRISINERVEWFLQNLAKEDVFVIHGKMKAEEKDSILLEFKNKETGGVLISTTVIEVGINIPSCNNIVIEDAENFGLAQLHQLRGRVGRGEEQGLCLLLYNFNLSGAAKKKLQEMKNSNDGFYLAQKDLEIRGYGDLLGIQQSGEDFFKITNLDEHANFLLPTLKYAKFLFNKIELENTMSYEETQQNTLELKGIIHKINVLFKIFNKDFRINYTKL